MDAMTSPVQAREARPDFADPRQMAAGFEEAAAAGEPRERWLTIAGRAVRVRSAGPEMLARLTRTFTHLGRPEGGEADLTVHLWDSATGDTSLPPLPDVGEGPHQPGAFFYYSDDEVRTGFQLGTSGDPRVLAAYPHAAPPSMSVLDTVAGEAFYWVADAARIPYWEEATAIRFVLDWWMREAGVYSLHAGAVGVAEGGVLLVGKSGSGKSTSTLACLESDLLYAGDDYVAVDTGAEPYVHSLYSSGKVMPDHVQRLPFLLPAVSNTDQLGAEKAVVYVHEHWPRAITAGFPLRALLAPQVTPRLVESRTVEISRIEGLAALAPSTVFQMHTRAKQSLASMSRLLEEIPCYRLELGSDIASIPRAVEGLLEKLA
jgi:hypothetical protein